MVVSDGVLPHAIMDTAIAAATDTDSAFLNLLIKLSSFIFENLGLFYLIPDFQNCALDIMHITLMSCIILHCAYFVKSFFEFFSEMVYFFIFHVETLADFSFLLYNIDYKFVNENKTQKEKKIL